MGESTFFLKKIENKCDQKMCASLFSFLEMRKVFPLVKTFLLSSNVILIDIFSQFQVLLRVC